MKQSNLFPGLLPEPPADSDSWCTPAWLVAEVQDVLGGIDLDPCSNADSIVPAALEFDRTDDGLSREWVGNVYCNPPYSDPRPWLERCKWHAQHGKARRWTPWGPERSVIALVKGDYTTRWWRENVGRSVDGICVGWSAASVCLVWSRLRFRGATTGAPFPSALVLWSEDQDVVKRFDDVFGKRGWLV